MGGTSREYLVGRLQKAERFDLLQGVVDGLISVHAAAIEAGFLQRRPTLGTGSSNMAKARNWALAKVTGRSPFRDDFPAVPLSEAKLEARRLAEAYADRGVEAVEGERRSRRLRRRRAAPPGPERDQAGPTPKVEPPAARAAAPPGPLLIHPELPCLSCTSWCAARAQLEIAATYLALRRGERVVSAALGAGLLPAACCRRQVRVTDAKALIA